MTKMVLAGALMAAAVILPVLWLNGGFTCHGDGTGIRIGEVVKNKDC